MSLYDQIGEGRIRQAITAFYRRAEEDGIIGHFFFEKDVDAIIEKQISFASNMLGGPKIYAGEPLAPVHAPLGIRPPHFGRRQVLMRDVLEEMGLEPELAKKWLELEEALRPVIFSGRRPPPR